MTPGFSSPPDPHEFRLKVWEMVKNIPVGCVATYGQIASLINIPEGYSPMDYRSAGARWVGGAMSTCPPDVPWQRVINSKGKISLAGAAGEEQRLLLESEEIIFSETGIIDFKKVSMVWTYHGLIGEREGR